MLLLTFQDEKGRLYTFNPAQITVIEHQLRRIHVGSYVWQLTAADFDKVLSSLVRVLTAGEPRPEPATSGLILPA